METPLIHNVPAIDINGCFGTGATCARMASKGFRTDLPFLQGEYRRLDIVASAQSTYGAVYGGADIEEENRILHTLTQTQDGLFQWVVVDPKVPNTLTQAEMLISSPKVLGFRLPNSTRRSSIAAYADELLALAAAQKSAVMVHPTHLPEILRFAEKYPGVNLIVPQLCAERLDKACLAETITAAKNIYTDTSGSPALLNNSLEFVWETCGPDRILFGSGGESLAFMKARVLLSVIPRADQEKILLHNALRCFPKLAQRKEVL